NEQLVYRFSTEADPGTLVPGMTRVHGPEATQKLVDEFKESPGMRNVFARFHAGGDISGGSTPFVSTAASMERAVGTSDDWLAGIAFGQPNRQGAQRAPDIAIFIVPKDRLVTPNHDLSTLETELLFEGDGLQQFLLRYIKNPF